MTIPGNTFIYVVDDDAVHLSMMQFMLRRIGFTNVEIFTDAEAAFDQMIIAPPDLVISDWNMDPIDGLQLLKSIRQSPRLADIPFVMVTANTSEHYWRNAITEGATEFLFKPLDYETFRQAILIALHFSDGLLNLNKLQLRHAAG